MRTALCRIQTALEADVPDNNHTSANLTVPDHDKTGLTAVQTDTTVLSNTETSQSLYDPASPPTVSNESMHNPTLAEFALRKSRAKAASLRESCLLEKLAREAAQNPCSSFTNTISVSF